MSIWLPLPLFCICFLRVGGSLHVALAALFPVSSSPSLEKGSAKTGSFPYGEIRYRGRCPSRCMSKTWLWPCLTKWQRSVCGAEGKMAGNSPPRGLGKATARGVSLESPGCKTAQGGSWGTQGAGGAAGPHAPEGPVIEMAARPAGAGP